MAETGLLPPLYHFNSNTDRGKEGSKSRLSALNPTNEVGKGSRVHKCTHLRSVVLAKEGLESDTRI